MPNPLHSTAQHLVRTRIHGHRKGMPDVPNYTHSLRVSEALAKLGAREGVVLAGMLHDILEDSDVTKDELRAEGFSERTIELIDLCSHDESIPNRDLRWIAMIFRIIDQHDNEALIIKTCDLLDNLATSHAMKPERQRAMREFKAHNLAYLAAGKIPNDLLEKLKVYATENITK